jgi:hypothetical protein
VPNQRFSDGLRTMVPPAANASETYSFSSFAGDAVYRQKPETYGVALQYDF